MNAWSRPTRWQRWSYQSTTPREWVLTVLSLKCPSRNRKDMMAARLWNSAPAATGSTSPGDSRPANSLKIRPLPLRDREMYVGVPLR